MHNHIIEYHKVPFLNHSVRVSDYGGNHLVSTPTRKSFKKAIKENRVLVNGNIAKTATYLSEGDVIEILEKKDQKAVSYDVDIDVVYEDAHMAIVNKPAGILTSGNQRATLVNALGHNLKKSDLIDALTLAHPVHRLDKAASGLLIIAKTKSAQLKLQDLLVNHQVDKTYRVIVYGTLPKSGIINTPLDDKKATTQYRTIEVLESNKYNHFSVADVQIVEGRPNQIRRHMNSIGHTIVGDRLFRTEHPGKGLYLVCYRMNLIHPITHEDITVEIPLPKKYNFLKPKP